MKAGIIGGSGYTGVELLRLLAGHPDIEVATVTAHSHAGQLVGEYTPSLAAAYPGMVYEAAGPHGDVGPNGDTIPNGLDGLDLVFCALPHGESQRIVPALRDRVGVIVDLAADFRLRDPALYPTWYGEAHQAPELLDQAAYGLPELFRQPLTGATLIAAAGCYPTAAGLALAPLVRAGLIEPSGIIVDAASGTSGAGRSATDSLHFGTVDENFVAYGLLTHRHTPEMQQILGAELLFTPHLAPMVRGILATCYARPAASAAGSAAASGTLSTADVMDALHRAYDHEPFVVVTDAPPSTKATSGSNCAHVTARVDERTGWVVSLCALDNLVKGASGQAVQCANVALGLPETTGLPIAGLYP
jgi:N-acetyl-gamma-glutamyl-phosphate reductase